MNHSLRIFRILVFVGCFLASNFTSAQNYRILVSNDDGIDSPLLNTLASTLKTLPDVEVVISAPRDNQSGSSNSSVGSPLVVDEVFQNGELFGYAVHGRPADAVTFGLSHLGKDEPFDLVVSGINRGANVGSVSHASGTVGTAVRALFMGVPAVAVSQELSGVDTGASARFAAGIVDKIRRDGAPDGVILSINIPGGKLQGVRVAPMGDSYLGREPYAITNENGNTTTYEGEYVRLDSQMPGTDTYFFQEGYITVTPIRFDWTDYEFLEELKSWNLD